MMAANASWLQQAAGAAAGGLGAEPYSPPPYDLVPPVIRYPFYYSSKPQLLSWIDDKDLSLLAPVVVYWAVSLAFHFVDQANIPYFEKHRIHEPEEVKSRNRVTVKKVVLAVIVQHIIQTAVGWLFLDGDQAWKEAHADHRAALQTYAAWTSRAAFALLGPKYGNQALRFGGAEFVSWMYWWGVPIAQFLFATFVMDTWQYFLHRYFHTNRFLYRHIHSWHHQLYVPYAFGALYNHPLEGLLFDTLGTGLAHMVSFMTTRQAIVLFAVSSLKTVDDHCGFALPWDPCQFLFGNNVSYHDIHHQHFGIKKNFSQPYFTHWDVILKTRMTPAQVPPRLQERYHAGTVKQYYDNKLKQSSPIPVEAKKDL